MTESKELPVDKLFKLTKRLHDEKHTLRLAIVPSDAFEDIAVAFGVRARFELITLTPDALPLPTMIIATPWGAVRVASNAGALSEFTDAPIDPETKYRFLATRSGAFRGDATSLLACIQ